MIAKKSITKTKTPIKKDFYKRFILTGAPGSGKGIIAQILEKEFNIPHVATGDILRSHVEKKTKIGKEIAELMKTGNLIKDEIVNKLIEKKLNESNIKNKFCLDGYPRHLAQAKFLLSKIDIDEVLVVKMTDKKIIARLKGRRVCPKCGASYHIKNIPPKVKGICDICGTKIIRRNDEDKIIHRLKLYHKETEPIIKYYKKLNLKIKYLPGDYNFKKEKEMIIEKIRK
jgi:adenylate kinase